MYGKELLIELQTTEIADRKLLREHLKTAYKMLEAAADHKIWSAHYLIGTVHQSPDFGMYNLEKAIHHYTIAAS